MKCDACKRWIRRYDDSVKYCYRDMYTKCEFKELKSREVWTKARRAEAIRKGNDQ